MGKPESLQAKDVSQMLLEKTGKALLSGDFETFAQCFALPHTIDTPDRKTTLKTKSALSLMFFRVVADYRHRNITNIIRFCEVAEYKDLTTIEATHISYMMSGSQRVIEPFPGFSVIKYIDGRWQRTDTQYAVDNETTVGRALKNWDQDADSTAAPVGTAENKKETDQ